MTCDECQDILQEYVDEELGPAEKSAMDAHIASCDACQRLHKKMAQFTTTMLQAVGPIRPTPDFSSKVMATLPGTPPDASDASNASSIRMPVKSFPIWPFALGIGVCVCLGLWLMFSSPTQPVLGKIRGQSEGVRVLVYQNNAWVEHSQRGEVPADSEVECDVDYAGNVVVIDCVDTYGTRISLQAPFRVRMVRDGSRLKLIMHRKPNPVLIQTGLGTGQKDSLIRIHNGEAGSYASVKSSDPNTIEVTPGKDLVVAVGKGTARVANNQEHKRLSEMFTTAVPDSGTIPLPSKVEAGRFDWAKKGNP